MNTFTSVLKRSVFLSIAIVSCATLWAVAIGRESTSETKPAVDTASAVSHPTGESHAEARTPDVTPVTIARAAVPDRGRANGRGISKPISARSAPSVAEPQTNESKITEDTSNLFAPLPTTPAASVAPAEQPRNPDAPDVVGCPITVLPGDGSTSGNERAPNSNFLFGRAHWLITPAEASANGLANGTSPVAIGFTYTALPGVAATGSLKVYLQNTADTTNIKSTNWATAISTMTLVSNSSQTLPNSTAPFDLSFSGGSPFTYTGGGLYVAFDWQWAGPNTATAVVLCNTALTNGLRGAQSNAAAPTTVANSSFRPETRLTPSTTSILNDASVDLLISYGLLPRDLIGPYVIQAMVSNRGVNPMTNLPVSLSVTGANPFSDTQVVASLPACSGPVTVSFAPLSSITMGADQANVSIPADQVASNNSKTVPMDVTVPQESFKYPGTIASGGVGFTGGTGAFVGKFTTAFATNITAVTLEFGAATATTYRVAIYADSGSGTPGAQLYLDAADRTVGAAGPVTIPIGPISVGPGNFFAGIHQTNTTNPSLSFDTESPIRVGKFYLATPLPVTTWFDFAPYTHFKLNIGVILDPCAGGTAVCDDGEPCTSDSCDAVSGCAHTSAPNGTPCDDSNPCTSGDSCTSGVCSGAGNGCFPPAGDDDSPTVGIFHVDVSGIGPAETSVSGMTHLHWDNPQTDPGTGLHTVQTELVSMTLSGSSPTLGTLTARAGSANGLPPSLGQVTQIAPGSDFPANAFFDVFFDIEVNGTTHLRNTEPLRMEADITEIPPRAIGLRNANPITITNTLDQSQVSVLQTAQHWMCPPPFLPGQPCFVPCNKSPYPVCSPGDCPGFCSILNTKTCRVAADCTVAQGTCIGVGQCVPNKATGTCVCQSRFPVASTDLSPTTGIFRVDLTGLGTVDTSVAGNTLLQWQDPVTGPGGQRTVQTEMLSLDLTGSDPTIGSLHVRGGTQNGLPASTGSVVSINPGADFPANAFFDVFFDIEVNGTTHLRNDQPLVMRADITEIPPRNIGLRNDTPIQIRDLAPPGQINTIQTAQHWMCPPPFPPPGQPCPVPCDRNPYPVCSRGTCPNANQFCVPFNPYFPQDGLFGKCVCVTGFPVAGTDTSPTVGTFQVDLSGIGPVQTTVSGQTLLQWQNPVVGPGGQRTVQTEMVALNLSGSDPSLGNITIHGGTANGLQPSLGSVTPQQSGSDFPALATFDVFFEVVVNGTTTLRNDQPLVMRAPITEIPPRSIGLQNAQPVPLRNLANPSQINTIQTAQHWMCPPPFLPPGCPVPCERNPFPVCKLGTCPPDPLTGVVLRCVPDRVTHACKCVKPGFPPHGADLSPTTGLFRVNISGVGIADAQVSGQVLLRWQDAVTGPGGQRTVQTEMLSLDLTGTSPTLGPLHVRGGSNQGLPASLGQVTAQQPGADFPADSFFDVFFKVDAGGTQLVNDQPLHMQAEITEIPPRSISLTNAAPVPLRNVNNPALQNSIQNAAHWMCPPPYPPTGQPCPVQCNATPQPLCSFGVCPNGLQCVSNAAGCGCVAPLVATSGEASGPSAAVPLKVNKAAGGQITLTWSPSCITFDLDFAIYDGLLPSFYSHSAILCSTAGATTKTLTPAASSRYYLVVPHQASVEGSYGRRSSGVERPQGGTACLPQSIGTCP